MKKPEKHVLYFCMMFSCFALVLFLLSSCRSTQEGFEHGTVTPTVLTALNNTVTPRPVVTLTSTSTHPSSSITPAYIKSPTNTRVVTITETSFMFEQIPSCQNGEHPHPLDNLNGVDGVIIYTDTFRTKWFTFQGFPPRSTEMLLPESTIDSLVYLNNGDSLIAYQSKLDRNNHTNIYQALLYKDGQRQILDFDLSKMSESAQRYFNKSISPQYWLLERVNNHVIKATVKFGETPKTTTLENLYSYFDISENVTKEITYGFSNWGGYLWHSISPDLTRVLYLDNKYNLILWDMEKEKELWNSPSVPFGQVPPTAEWSFDSRFVAYRTLADIGSITILSADGKTQKIVKSIRFSNLNQKFVSSPGFFRWAPTSQQLAISGIITDENNNSWKSLLLLYDVEKEIFSFTCSYGDSSSYAVSSDILWSPDGNFIVTRYSNMVISPLRLIDLKRSIVYQLDSEVAAVEWITHLPEKWKQP